MEPDPFLLTPGSTGPNRPLQTAPHLSGENEPDPFFSVPAAADAAASIASGARPTPGLVLHHARGSQYTGARYRAKAEAAKIQLSMSRPGMPYDNAMAESFFATLKLELADDKSFESRDAARTAVFEYVELFYNRVRMQSALGYRSPMQAEREHQPVRFVS